MTEKYIILLILCLLFILRLLLRRQTNHIITTTTYIRDIKQHNIQRPYTNILLLWHIHTQETKQIIV